MNAIDLKHKIKQHCLKLLNGKISALSIALQSVTEAANNETKSTAGDKHETAKAMMQLEQEKLGKQLSELENQVHDLEKIDIDTIKTEPIKGSLIETDRGWFFVGIGFGKLLIENQIIFAVSEQSPIGKFLLESKLSSGFEFNGIRYLLKSIQ